MKQLSLIIAGSIMLWGEASGISYAGTSRDQSSLIEADTAVAIDLYQQLRHQSGNFCFSPYALSLCMATVYAGARAETETEIGKVMYFSSIKGDLHHSFHDLSASVRALQRSGVELALGSSLWYDKDESLNASYVGLLRADYGTSPCEVDFVDAAGTAESINNWFALQTMGHIKNAVTSAHFDSTTRLMVCSAIYFNGRWATEFDERRTRQFPFFVGEAQAINTPTMQVESTFKSRRADGIAFLELPYIGGSLAMYILLPEDYGDLSSVEQRLTASNVTHWLHDLVSTRSQRLSVLLPRLKVGSNTELSKALSAMGMPALFSDSKADLSGISARDHLFVSEVMHQATVEVNEKGTKAYAATTAQFKTKSAMPCFMVDHPFIFFIADERNQSILFAARVTDPSKS